jgi:hypothetical protein
MNTQTLLDLFRGDIKHPLFRIERASGDTLLIIESDTDGESFYAVEVRESQYQGERAHILFRLSLDAAGTLTAHQYAGEDQPLQETDPEDVAREIGELYGPDFVVIKDNRM